MSPCKGFSHGDRSCEINIFLLLSVGKEQQNILKSLYEDDVCSKKLSTANSASVVSIKVVLSFFGVCKGSKPFVGRMHWFFFLQLSISGNWKVGFQIQKLCSCYARSQWGLFRVSNLWAGGSGQARWSPRTSKRCGAGEGRDPLWGFSSSQPILKSTPSKGHDMSH